MSVNFGTKSSGVPKGMPLRHIRAGKLVRYEAGNGWYRIAAKGRVTARVVHPADAFLCRLGPPKGNDIVQLSIGRVRSLIADSLFSPKRDLGLRFSGKGVRLEWKANLNCYVVSCTGGLTVHVKRNLYREDHGIKWYRPLDKSIFNRAPTGWCSWYIYYKDIDEEKILRNVEWLGENLSRFGLEYAQIDDGWQGDSAGHGSNREWSIVCAERFPHGMKWLAEQIRDAGLVPGIWLIPFSRSDTDAFRQCPDMFLRDAKGRSVAELRKPVEHTYMGDRDRMYLWSGRYMLDPTSPRAHAYLGKLFTMLCREWGYSYVKIDAQGYVVPTFTRYRGRFRRSRTRRTGACCGRSRRRWERDVSS